MTKLIMPSVTLMVGIVAEIGSLKMNVLNAFVITMKLVVLVFILYLAIGTAMTRPTILSAALILVTVVQF